MDKKPEQQSSSPVQKASNRSSKLKRFFGKKWVFPGIYMLAAALILAFMWWYQGTRNTDMNPKDIGIGEQQEHTTGQAKDGAVPANAKAERMIRPAAEGANMTMKFYDENASDKEKEAALVQYGSSFNPHTGVDFARKDGKPFDVLAALSGTVQSVETNPLNGQEVRIAHDNGTETIYQSLGEVKVKEGDKVSQGDVLGTAGRNKVEKDSGIHLHFEVKKDGDVVNPQEQLSNKAE